MAKASTPISAAEAQAVWLKLNKPSVPKLAQALKEAGTPVSAQTLQKWRKAGWKVSSNRKPPEPVDTKKVEETLRTFQGVDLEIIEAYRKLYENLEYAALIEHTGRHALVTANIGMRLIQENFILWASENSKGLGALCVSMAALIRDGQAECEKAMAMAQKALGEAGATSGTAAVTVQQDDPLDSVLYEFNLRRLPAGHGTTAHMAA